MINEIQQSRIIRILDDNHPWLGLEYYQEENKEFFYGREEDTLQLFRLVQRNVVTVLSGKSGLGKTSLIKAGLMAKLRKADFYPIYIRLNFDNPEKRALDLIKSSIYQEICKIDPSLPEFGDDTLWEYFHKYRILNGYAIPVIIFDQFEEFFTRGEAKPPEFQLLKTEIVDLVENQIPLSFQQTQQYEKASFDIKSQNYRILFSLREDYLARLETLSQEMPSLKKSRYRLVQMTRQQALQAIVQPGKAIITEEQANVILQLIYEEQIKNTNKPEYPALMEIEPFLLSLICYQINEKRISRKEQKIKNDLLESIQIRNIIKEFYESKMAYLPYQAVHLLEEMLITKDGYRKLQPMSDLTDTGMVNEKDITNLVNGRILRKEIWAGREHIELIHDVLVPIIKEKQSSHDIEQKLKKRLERVFIILGGLIITSVLIGGISAIFLNKEATKQRDIASAQRDSASVQRDSALFQKGKVDQLLKMVKLQKDSLEIFNRQLSTSIGDVKEQKKLVEIEASNTKLANNSLEAKNSEVLELLTRITTTQTEEKNRTIGKLEELKKMDDYDKEKAEYYISNVATYLWLKEDQSSLDTLIRLMQDYEKYIPYDYGQKIPNTELTSVKDSTDWPLTISINPGHQFDIDKFNYFWQNQSVNLAQKWGIPTPTRIKLAMDNNLSIDQIKISSPVEKEQTFTLPEQEGYVLVSKGEITDNRLLYFFETVKDKKEVKELNKRDSGPWYLFPKWTQPIFKAGNYNAYPGEAGIALTFASFLLDNPEFLLNNDVVKLLLSRENKEKPVTVREAVLNRGGISNIRLDLIEIVKNRYSLLPIKYYLDILADTPFEGSHEDAISAPNAFYTGTTYASISNTIKNKTQFNVDSEFFKGSFSRYTENFQRTRPYKESMIQIYAGADIINEFTTKDLSLTSRYSVVMKNIRSDLYQAFGIEFPSTRLYNSSSTYKNRELQIRMFNRDLSDNELNPDSIPKDFQTEMLKAGAKCRIFGIDPDQVEEMLSELPENYQAWIRKTYTLTDIKNILRSVINPDQTEIDKYQTNMEDSGIYGIPAKNTIIHTEWLLKSLVFWLQSGIDYQDIDKVRDVLLETQFSRITLPSYPGIDSLTKVQVLKGLEKLNDDKIPEAIKIFGESFKRNPTSAKRAFLQEFPKFITFDMEEIKLNPVIPGKISKYKLLSQNELIQLELFKNDPRNKISDKDFLNILIKLFLNYLGNEDFKKVDEILATIEKLTGKVNWDLNEKYLIGYAYLKNNIRWKTNPEKIHEIEKLLSECVRLWDESNLSRIYRELVDLIQKEFNDLKWSNQLIKQLALQRPENYWVNYLSANYFQSLGKYEQLINSFEFLEKAEKSISEKEQAKSLFWLKLEKGRILSKLSGYSEKPNWKTNVDKGIDLLKSLSEEPLLSTTGWPRKVFVYQPLYSIYINSNEIDSAKLLVENELKSEPDEMILLRYQLFIHLALGDIKSAFAAGEKIESVAQKPEDEVGLPLIHILINDPNSEYVCNRFLSKKDHFSNDFIRLWEYYFLVKNGNVNRGKEKLISRWNQIDSTTWKNRINGEDFTVWGEIWIGHYLNKIDESYIFNQLKDKDAYENCPFNKMETYREMICDAYFYRALLKAAEGNKEEYKKSLEKAISTDCYDFYEYQIAKYLLKTLL